ncbi:MAG: PhoU domain-containing protein [Candidatus Bathyarchaeia archaeon]
MELRKVQQTPSGTFFVCLPKTWAEQNGLNRGSIVALSETSNGRLIIDSKYDVERAPRIITLKPGPYLDREVIGKYLLGYDIIRVETKDKISPEIREGVKQAASKLVGLEIIEEDYSKIVLQCLLEPSTFPPEKVLRREYSIAASMHRDAVTALIDGDIHLAKNVIARDNEVNRLYFLLVRILRTVIQNPSLSEKLEIRPIDCLDYRLAASLVEAIGDQSAHIGEKVTKMDGKKPEESLVRLILQFHSRIYETHENALNALFAHDIVVAEQIKDEKTKITEAFQELETKITTYNAKDAPQILAAVSAIYRIYDHTVDIADLVMPKLP